MAVSCSQCCRWLCTLKHDPRYPEVTYSWRFAVARLAKLDGSPPLTIRELDWDPPEKHAKRECWLSYYGLPEPPSSGLSLPWMVAIASVTMLILAVGLRSWNQWSTNRTVSGR